MIVRCGRQTFSIDKQRGITHEAFVRLYKTIGIAEQLITARLEFNSLLNASKPAKELRRQREKIARLEKRYDKARLSI